MPPLHRWIIPTTVILTAIIFQYLHSIGFDLFSYQRAAVISGEIWRLITAHFIHLGWSHLVLNMVVFVAFWWLFDTTFKPLNWLILILSCSVGISLGFVLLDNDLLRYVGFSGVLHGLFIAAALQLLLDHSRYNVPPFRWEALLIVIGIFAKIGYEQFMGPVPMTQKASGGDVIVSSHLFGTIMGCGSVALFQLMRKSADN